MWMGRQGEVMLCAVELLLATDLLPDRSVGIQGQRQGRMAA